MKPNKYYGYFSDDLLYRKGRLKSRIELILLSRQSVLFGEGAQRALQHGNRAVDQAAAAASGQQLAQALQGAIESKLSQHDFFGSKKHSRSQFDE